MDWETLDTLSSSVLHRDAVFYTAPSRVAAASCEWLLRTWNATEGLGFVLYLTLRETINSYIDRTGCQRRG